MIVGFCGLPGVGKDTAADHMVAEHGFIKFHPADTVIESAEECPGECIYIEVE